MATAAEECAYLLGCPLKSLYARKPSQRTLANQLGILSYTGKLNHTKHNTLYDLHHPAGKGVPLGGRVIELVLHTRDMFPELEHLFCRRKRIRADDRDR